MFDDPVKQKLNAIDVINVLTDLFILRGPPAFIIKQFHRIATRYEKLGASFLAMVKLTSIHIWLRAIESTA